MAELRFVGLDHRANTTVKNLPYGDRRRVEIARALATAPTVLLLDEPAAGMNPQESNELVGVVERIRERDITVVLVEHHITVAEFLHGDGAVPDLAQGHDRVLIAVAVDHGLGARRNVARPMRRQQHQREPVGDFFYAIFDGYAGQGVLPLSQTGLE